MRKSVPAMLLLPVLLGFAPVAALAAACGEFELSDAQLDFVATQGLEITVPDGDTPVIQRCDVNADMVVDINDIRAISMNRNQPAAHPDDPMDWDKNMVINVLDARGCQRVCALPRCVTPTDPEPPEEQMGGEFSDAECSQVVDLDGVGGEDFIGVSEHTGEDTRGGEWTLEVVILTEDDSGNVEAITYPYTGQNLQATGELTQHVSMQPAGTVNLNPGTLVIDQPAVVSYQNGEPQVIYYFENGQVARAFYGVDD